MFILKSSYHRYGNRENNMLLFYTDTANIQRLLDTVYKVVLT